MNYKKDLGVGCKSVDKRINRWPRVSKRPRRKKKSRNICA